MKKQMISIGFFLVALTSIYAEDSIKFADYKQLSQVARQKITGEASSELKEQYNRWSKIIDSGGVPLNLRQAAALDHAKGLSELGGLFTAQENLWGYFHLDVVAANRKSGMTKKQVQQLSDATAGYDYVGMRKEHEKDRWYLIRLAPTPEALALNARAAVLTGQWYARFSGPNGQKLTKEDLKVIDAAVEEIRGQMRKLPLWTPEQMEAALADLPEEEPHH